MKNNVLNNNIVTLAELGIMHCPKCNQFEYQSLDINFQTRQKYIVCYNCFEAKEISQEEFDKLIIYSKTVPQDREIIENVWKIYAKINVKYTIDYINKNTLGSFEEKLEKICTYNLRKAKQEYKELNELNDLFLSVMMEESVKFFIQAIGIRMEIIEKEKEEEKYKNLDKINDFMKKYYQKTISNIIEKEPKLFDEMHLNFQSTVFENENTATIIDPDYIYKDISNELFSIKIVNSICHLYKYIEETKEGYNDLPDCYFDIKHIVTFAVLSNNVDVKISNSFFTDEETKVIIKSIAFKNILKIFTKENIEKHKEEDRFYADLISEFIEKEYYKYGPDLGTAIYIYENKKYFKEYIYGEKEAKNFLNLVKKLEPLNINEQEENKEENNENYNTVIIGTEDNTNKKINKTNSQAISGFIFSILSIFLHIIAFYSVYKSIKALSEIEKTNEKGIGLAISGIIISSLYILVFFYNLSLL